MVLAADGGVAQQQVAASVGSNGAVLAALPNVKAPKNGYAYIYISNQSNNDSLSRWITYRVDTNR